MKYLVIVIVTLLAGCVSSPQPKLWHCRDFGSTYEYMFDPSKASDVWLDPISGRGGLTVVDTHGKVRQLDSHFTKCTPMSQKVFTDKTAT